MAIAFIGLTSAPPASAPSSSAQGVQPGAVNAAIEAGVERLLSLQGFDGSWAYGGRNSRVGANALCVYTLLRCGLSAEDHAIQRGLAWLEGASTSRTYDASCLLLALCAHDPQAQAERIDLLVGQLLSWQDEGWSYPGGAGDLSNTQYAALGLRAAALAGFEVPRISWLELAEAVMHHGVGDGGFGYKAMNSRSTGSMTAAGVGTLAICRERLARDDGLPPKLEQRIEERIRDGLSWLERHWSVSANPGTGTSWLGYYLYGLERVGGLVGVRTIGGHDWYAEGARYLLRKQEADGSWNKALGASVPKSCFPLLFLRRATAPVTGVAHRFAGKPRHASKLEGADFQLTAVGDTPLGMWISRWQEDALEGLIWPGEEGRGPHLQRVDYFADGDLVVSVWGDDDHPVGNELFSAQIEFGYPGPRRMHAEAIVLEPPYEDSGGRTWPGSPRKLVSGDVLVDIREAVPDWMLENARDPARNRMPFNITDCSASSFAGNAHAPRRAVDGNQESAWVAAEGDESPWFRLSFPEPVRANRVVLGHARSSDGSPGAFARAPFAIVRLNGGKEHRVPMSPDARQKSRLKLPRPFEIRTLDVRLPHRVASPGGSTAVGIAEIEFQLVADE